MNPITQLVLPSYTITSCDPIAPYIYKLAEEIWMPHGIYHSVARIPESLSVFSHFCYLNFADNLPSLHTAGLFSYQNIRKSARASVLKYSERHSLVGVYIEAGNKFTSWLKPFQSQLKSSIVRLINMEIIRKIGKFGCRLLLLGRESYTLRVNNVCNTWRCHKLSIVFFLFNLHVPRFVAYRRLAHKSVCSVSKRNGCSP